MIHFESLHYKIFEKTNMARIAHAREALTYSKELSIVASLHATQMKQYDFFSHTNPHHKSFKKLTDRVSYFNLKFSKVSENIADLSYLNTNGEQRFEIKNHHMGTAFYSLKNGKQFFNHDIDTFSSYVVEAWMHSKGHRKNILDKGGSHLGCGAVLYYRTVDNYGTKIPYLKVVQNFGKP